MMDRESTVPNGAMTKRERDDLAQHCRRLEKVAKAATSQRSAEILADIEQQMATEYAFEDGAWEDVTAEAKRIVKEADAEIARRCKSLGIPAEFRPSLNLGWYNRGQNASHQRRAELRKVAQTRVLALEKQAKVIIERKSVETQTEILVSGLETAAARAFLAAMPTVESLMPPLDLKALEAALPGIRAQEEARLTRSLSVRFTDDEDEDED